MLHETKGKIISCLHDNIEGNGLFIPKEVICLGHFTLCGFGGQWDISKSGHQQHLLADDIAKALDSMHEVPSMGRTPITFQDPAYNELDVYTVKNILSLYGSSGARRINVV
jgi:hypothetical protein